MTPLPMPRFAAAFVLCMLLALAGAAQTTPDAQGL
jgi:hypothetical protein